VFAPVQRLARGHSARAQVADVIGIGTLDFSSNTTITSASSGSSDPPPNLTVVFDFVIVKYHEFVTREGTHPYVPSCWYVHEGTTFGVCSPIKLLCPVMTIPSFGQAEGSAREPLVVVSTALGARRAKRFFCLKPLV